MSQLPYEPKTGAEQQSARDTESNVVVRRRYALIHETRAWGNRRLWRVTARDVYHALHLYADVEGFCTIRIKRLAALFGVSKRAIQYHLTTLIRCGLVRRFPQRRPEGGSGADHFWVAHSGIPTPPCEGDLHPAGEKDLHYLARTRRVPTRTDQLAQKEADLQKSEQVLGRCAPRPAASLTSDEPPERGKAPEDSLRERAPELGKTNRTPSPGSDHPATLGASVFGKICSRLR
jgi:hypothetical protein